MSKAARAGAARATAARLIATWFGCGLAPRAPGTVGSLGALPLHLSLRETPLALHVALVLLMVGGGTWAAHRYAIEQGEHDPQRVVIDEVAGTLIALVLVRDQAWFVQLLALVLFRVFDIWKPGPIRAAERLEPRGVGIMADDLIAGLFAGFLAFLIARF